MREFSLFHSRFRQLPFVVAVVAVAAVLVVRGGSPDAGGQGVNADGESPPSSLPAAGPAGLTDADDDPFAVVADGDARTGTDVPFISLQPAPDGMTEFGRSLADDVGQSTSTTRP